MKKVLPALLAAVLLLAGLPTRGAAAGPAKRSVTGYYLDTIITLTAYVEDEEILWDAMAECERYEELLSRTVEGSDVWRINHAEGKPVTVSEDTVRILETAREISELSDGAFDVTIQPVMELWDFSSGEAKLPDAAAVEAAAKRVDYTAVKIEDDTVTLPKGMGIDLGAIAKGYIADQIKAYLTERGVESAILSFGGNIVAIGLKPTGKPWKVGVQDIDRPAGETMLVSLNFGGSTVTSGIYERSFEVNGVTYHHLLDPKTGWPVQNELASVTVFSENSMEGDALSTAVFLLGPEKGAELIESREGVEALFITRDRAVTMTSGAEKYIQS